jgi:hypothetical protein
MTNFFNNALTILENDLLAKSPIKRTLVQRQVRKDIACNIEFTPIHLGDSDLQTWIYHDNMWNSYTFTHDSLIGKYINTPLEADGLIQLVEDFVLGMYLILRARTLMDKYVAVATFAKFRGTKMDNNVLLAATLRSAFDFYNRQNPTEDLYVQGIEFADFKSFLGMYDTIKSSPAFEKFPNSCS